MNRIIPVSLVAVLIAAVSTAAAWADGYQVKLVDGTAVVASAITIDEAGRVSLGDQSASLVLSDIVSIEPAEAPATASSPIGGGTIHLVSGGSFSVADIRVVDDQVQFAAPSGIASIPIAGLRAVVWDVSPATEDLIRNPSTDSDAVLVRKGDQVRGVEGVIEGLTDQHVQLRYKNKSRKIGRDKIAAIVMADLQLPIPKEAARVVAEVIGEGTVEGALLSWADDQVTIGLGGDAVLNVPVTGLVRLTCVSDRVVYLSDLTPTSSKQRAMFTLDRPWQRDRSIEGWPLTLFDTQQQRPVTFKKGIGTHSWSSIVFSNDREFDRLVAVAGIDAETGGRGACRMIVRGDGIELWAAEVTGSSGLQVLDVSIEGIGEVELEVVPGKDFDLADHADWCDARFLKTK